MKNQYFERQGKLSSDCAKCSLNNFIGKKQYSTNDMDAICKELSDDFINPHKSFFGGDYDVNVLIHALKNHSLQLRWVKKDENLGELLLLKDCYGFFINIEKKKQIWHHLLDKSARHWYCLKRISQKQGFRFFDSEKEQSIDESFQATLKHLQELRLNNQTILCVFPTSESQKTGTFQS